MAYRDCQRYRFHREESNREDTGVDLEQDQGVDNVTLAAYSHRRPCFARDRTGQTPAIPDQRDPDTQRIWITRFLSAWSLPSLLQLRSPKGAFGLHLPGILDI